MSEIILPDSSIKTNQPDLVFNVNLTRDPLAVFALEAYARMAIRFNHPMAAHYKRILELNKVVIDQSQDLDAQRYRYLKSKHPNLEAFVALNGVDHAPDLDVFIDAKLKEEDADAKARNGVHQSSA